MSHETTQTAFGVPAVPRRRPGRLVLRARVRLARRRLDAALAEGADPWSSAELMTRAAQISASGHRRRLASALEALVELAERPRPVSPQLSVRAAGVLRERELILALARCVRDPAPVDAGVVARLAGLVWDDLSPAFAGGRPVDELARTLELCAPALAD